MDNQGKLDGLAVECRCPPRSHYRGHRNHAAKNGARAGEAPAKHTMELETYLLVELGNGVLSTVLEGSHFVG